MMENYEELLDQLRHKQIERIEISKEQFLAFREVLIRDSQFKHFRGEAQQGGSIIFTYLENARV